MIRFILTKNVQDGYEHDAPVFKTVDIDVPELEALLGPGGWWRVAGTEMPAPASKARPEEEKA